MKFYELLIRYRKKKGLSLVDLANKIEVTPNYIGNIEKQYTKAPTVARCNELARALGLNKQEKDTFIESAIKERSKTETLLWLENNTKEIFNIPVISWVHANQFSAVEDPFPPGHADEYVITSTKGENMFALKVKSDCMLPEFAERDIIIVKPNVHITNGDYVVVKDTRSNEATFKQYKRKGNKIILHPLNSKYPDIVLDDNEAYEIIGKIVEKVKKY